MAEAPSTRRRWFQFSLGTMLLAVMALAVWLGWNLSYVRQREATIKFLKTANGTGVMPDPVYPWRSLPITWRLLGAEPIGRIQVTGKFFPKEEQRRLQEL